MANKRTKILIVEDEPGMAMILNKLLEDLDYSVLPIEKTGEGAIKSANLNNPDLILMDIYLEGDMNGIQAAERILNEKNIPVIYATSDSDEKTIQSARTTYPLGYILKPYNRNVLKSTIEVALSIREVEARKNQELQEAYQTISLQTQEILESHKSAKDIQKAILPLEKNFISEVPNSFILNMPKERLGGDFFWYRFLEDGSYYFAAVDCTGHGVPGSLMSILVNYQLTRTLDKLKLQTQLGKIFSKIDTVLSDSFEDQLEKRDTKDIHNLNAGFDAALCHYDPATKILTYCGAKRPLLLIRDNQILEYKGNRASVGLFTVADKEFATTEVELQEGDHIYVYSDGFPDQIGGERERRLKSVMFKEFLLEISKLPLEVQKDHLRKKFDSWKGEEEQMDDVLVVGLRI